MYLLIALADEVTKLQTVSNSGSSAVLDPQTIPGSSKAHKDILLIEDNEEAAFLVEAALKKDGNRTYLLHWSKSLTEGREHLLRNSVDLVLLDLGLPESSGPETYRLVRDVAPVTPVLVLTGDGAQETESAITADDGVDFLVKDEVSGPLLLRAIELAIYSNKLK